MCPFYFVNVFSRKTRVLGRSRRALRSGGTLHQAGTLFDTFSDVHSSFLKPKKKKSVDIFVFSRALNLIPNVRV